MIATAPRGLVFQHTLNTWNARRRQMGDGAVGRRGEDAISQGHNIELTLRKIIGDRQFTHALDFGCGWGRFSELLVGSCSHLWSLDIFKDWVDRAANHPTATGLVVTEATIPLENASVDLVVDIMTFQSLGSDDLRLRYANELDRVSAPGATTISMVKVGDDWNLTHLPAALKLDGGWRKTVVDSIDAVPDTYYFLEGVKRVK